RPRDCPGQTRRRPDERPGSYTTPPDTTGLIGLSRLLARVAAKAWIEGTSDFGDLPGFRDAKPGASDAENLSFQDD
ncbi:hypothetical protein, partial [Azospirillum sp. TSH58]|uniref:hypothetical protein n=1 Tax=Azospirillum sp. TSH58 TaxID=664962 RepID=UPI001B3B833B